MSKSLKVLIVLTSHAKLGDTGTPTGFWLEELAAPYYAFLAEGASVDLASPSGGLAPVDPKSRADAKGDAAKFLTDADAMKRLETTAKLADVRETYDVYFVAGGHGVMWDLAKNADLAKLLGDAADHEKVVAAVCHGPAALTNVTTKDGAPLVRGKRVAGFSNEEEAAVKLTDIVPFALESKLVELGGRYERGPMWGAFAIRDGKLVTGQNPQSSVATAKEALAAWRA